MKKVILGILSVLLISPLFVNGDILGIVDIVDSTGENIYYELTDMCNQYSSATPKNIISYGFGKYTDLNSFSYYDINGNSVSSVDPCSIIDNPGVYVYGLNNGYFTDSSGNNVLLGSLVSTGLTYYPFTFGFNFSYGLNSESVFNGNLYLKLPVGNNYNFRNSYYITINGNNNNSSVVNLPDRGYSSYRFVRLYTEYNILNFWDSSSFITNFGSVVDVPSGCIRILYTTLSDGGYSSIFNCSGGLQFKTIAGSDINYTIYDEFSSVDFLDKNRDYLFLHFNNYSSEYLSGKLSIIVKNTSSGFIYNIYPFVNSVNQLSGVDPLRKGYLNGSFFSYSLSNSTELPYYFDSYGSYNNGLSIRSYNRGKYYFSSSLGTIYPYISSTSTLTFNEDNSVPKINLGGNVNNNDQHNMSGYLNVLCKLSPNNPLCKEFTYSTGDYDISFSQDGSGNIVGTITIYETDQENCPDMYYTGIDGYNYHQYFEGRVCYQAMVFPEDDSSPGESNFLFSGSDLTGLQSQIGLALSGIVGSNFKFYSCPFNSPLRAFHLSSIGGLSSFLLDKFFDINLVGPFNCLLGGILYSETDSVSLGSRLLSDTYDGEKFLNHFSDDVKNTISWLLFVGMVLFFWAFRPKEH